MPNGLPFSQEAVTLLVLPCHLIRHLTSFAIVESFFQVYIFIIILLVTLSYRDIAYALVLNIIPLGYCVVLLDGAAIARSFYSICFLRLLAVFP